MLKISKIADYAVVILADMANKNQQKISVSTIANSTGLAEPTISKVLKALLKAGIVESTRGIYGGYSIKGPPNKISIEDIIKAVDGPVLITSCSHGSKPDCSVSQICAVKGRWDDINIAISEILSSVSLTDMMGNMKLPTNIQQLR